MKHIIIQGILSLAIDYNYPLHHLDVECMFLHGDLHETICMSQPPGYVDPNLPTYICKMQKSIYGLHQVWRARYEKLNSSFCDMGFTISSSDPSLFIYHDGHSTAYLCMHVNDIILTGTSLPMLHCLI